MYNSDQKFSKQKVAFSSACDAVVSCLFETPELELRQQQLRQQQQQQQQH